ncbi:MAG: Holliday junction resolvase RuvX [Anaerolineales bacterium]|nr:Holliday junction resolvase RuvX [Anaerolineales bacterium]
MSRVLAVDPGEVRIGLAVSDPLGIIARPLRVLQHTARPDDARRVAQEARAVEAELIVVGVAYDQEGDIGPQARRNLRFVEALRDATDLPVETWDETETTQRALELGGDDDQLDARAAAVMLQEYLDVKARS